MAVATVYAAGEAKAGYYIHTYNITHTIEKTTISGWGKGNDDHEEEEERGGKGLGRRWREGYNGSSNNATIVSSNRSTILILFTHHLYQDLPRIGRAVLPNYHPVG